MQMQEKKAPCYSEDIYRVKVRDRSLFMAWGGGGGGKGEGGSGAQQGEI